MPTGRLPAVIYPVSSDPGGKERLGGISKRGDGYLRRLLIHGARAIVGWRHDGAHQLPARGAEIEAEPRLSQDANFLAVQIVERLDEVLGAPAPSG